MMVALESIGSFSNVRSKFQIHTVNSNCGITVIVFLLSRQILFLNKTKTTSRQKIYLTLDQRAKKSKYNYGSPFSLSFSLLFYLVNNTRIMMTDLTTLKASGGFFQTNSNPGVNFTNILEHAVCTISYQEYKIAAQNTFAQKSC